MRITRISIFIIFLIAIAVASALAFYIPSAFASENYYNFHFPDHPNSHETVNVVLQSLSFFLFGYFLISKTKFGSSFIYFVDVALLIQLAFFFLEIVGTLYDSRYLGVNALVMVALGLPYLIKKLYDTIT
jgi:hypothetical protein